MGCCFLSATYHPVTAEWKRLVAVGLSKQEEGQKTGYRRCEHGRSISPFAIDVAASRQRNAAKGCARCQTSCCRATSKVLSKVKKTASRLRTDLQSAFQPIPQGRDVWDTWREVVHLRAANLRRLPLRVPSPLSSSRWMARDHSIRRAA